MSIAEAEPDPSSEHARLQPVERTAEEHLERLRHDIDTVLQLQLHGWSDEASAPVAEALAEYWGRGLTGWLYTREVFVQVARGGFGGLRQCPDSWLLDDNGDTITGLVGQDRGGRVALLQVQGADGRQVGRGQGRQSGHVLRGAVQATVRQRLQHRWYTNQCNNRLLPDEDVGDWTKRNRGVAATVVELISAERFLDRLSAPLAREIFRKKFVDRYTFEGSPPRPRASSTRRPQRTL